MDLETRSRFPSNEEMLDALLRWVEHGEAPQRLNMALYGDGPKPIRTRPIFPYPQVAKYRGSGSTRGNLPEFPWPSPPYVPNQTTPNPARNDGVGNDPPMIQGSAGTMPDQQLHPGFQGPYGNNTVTATQTFLWEWSNLNNGAFSTFPGISYQIVRTASSDGKGGWMYTSRKMASLLP